MLGAKFTGMFKPGLIFNTRRWTPFLKLLLLLMAIVLLGSLLIACRGNAVTSSSGTTTVAPSLTTTHPPISNASPTPPVTTSVPGSTTSPKPVAHSTPGTPPVTNLSPVNVGQIPRTQVTGANYVVFAWNDLGMHCANPTYDTTVLLPPYNTIWAQVIQRGNPPQIISQGITVDYSIVNNTDSYSKGSFNQFWDNSQKLFGLSLEKNTGLNLSDPNVHNSLSGSMAAKTDHFEAVGIPLTPIDDSNVWNPYQVAEITVKDSGGNTLAQTRTMAPISTEINCAKCHGSDAFNDILVKHDTNQGTTLVNQEPVLCASCHGDPALGVAEAGPNQYLSERIHGFHAGLASQPTCYDCHPGQTTQCSRSLAHTASDGNCISCHGDLKQVSASIEGGRIPWVNEPGCVTCHTGVAQVDTGTDLYRNSTGHGGVYCTSCHSSPHAMVPTSQEADNYQALQYQGKAVPISDCAACHRNSKGESNLREYLEAHGGTNPERANGCYICHTSVNTADTSQWPHSFQWKNR
jgi:hypothetical protein